MNLMKAVQMNLYHDFGKRWMDIILGLAAFILVAPLMVLIALVVRVRLGSPVLYTQMRPGKDGRPFRLNKFRTMTTACDNAGQLLPDADRLTAFGKLLRSTSLDELPELWNILRGSMSLVGPRPLLPTYLELYTDRQARRHEVKPGLTGLAQVSGRNSLTWEERFEYDVQYVENYSFTLDFKILLRTAVNVLRRVDVSPPNQDVMPEFLGSELQQQKIEKSAA